MIDAVIIRFVWRQFSAGTEATAKSHSKKRTFSGSPVTQMQFTVGGEKRVLGQAVFHFSSLGCRLIERDDDACVFQRGAWLGGLLETDIRKLLTQLTVSIASADTPGESAALLSRAGEASQRVSCQWSVKTWGAWMMGRDVRWLEAEGHDFKALLGEGGTLSPSPPVRRASQAMLGTGSAAEASTTKDDESRAEEVESTLDAPALALMLVGSLMAIGHAATMYDTFTSPALDYVWVWLPGLLIGLLMFVAGIQTKFVQSRAWALIGSYAAYLPLSPGWLVSVGVGYVSVRTLERPEVIELFAQRRRQRRRSLAPLPEHVRPDIDGPSLLLIIAGVFTLLGNLGAAIFTIWTGQNHDWLFLIIGGLFTGLGMCIGGIKMRGASSLGWAQVGAVAAMIPVSAGWPLTLWVGIWCLSNLSVPHVRQAWNERGNPGLQDRFGRRPRPWLAHGGMVWQAGNRGVIWRHVSRPRRR